MIRLSSGSWLCELRPDLGGAVAALRRDGLDVLRPLAPGRTNPLETACFPLVPYCNRICDARFHHAGQEVQLSRNFAPEPHSLHGLGWQRPWDLVECNGASARLAHAHDGASEWPWAYRAEQHFALDPAGFTITLTLANRADRAMPAGLGLHPYFRRSAQTGVRFIAGALIPVGDDLIPTGARAPADTLAAWSQGTRLPAETVDHCHADWAGTVWIDDEHGGITLTATGAPHLHVYAPADGSALCFEPVSHLPDALNQAPETLPLLAPGAELSLAMRIELR